MNENFPKNTTIGHMEGTGRMYNKERGRRLLSHATEMGGVCWYVAVWFRKGHEKGDGKRTHVPVLSPASSWNTQDNQCGHLYYSL